MGENTWIWTEGGIEEVEPQGTVNIVGEEVYRMTPEVKERLEREYQASLEKLKPT
jgi:hypothetical protein